MYLRALQGHSGRSLIDPTLQDNVVIPDGFFKYNYHVGCAINLHSIINSGLIPGGQNLSNRQTAFFLPVDPMDKNHKDPDTIDLEAPRPPPKISLKYDWMKELGSEAVRQPEGEVAQQSKSSQSSQTNPNPDHDRTGKPVVCPQRGASRSQEIETRSFREEAVKHDRTVKPLVCRDENHEHPTVVCSEQTTHPRFSREGQNLILEEETNHNRMVKPVVCPQAGAPQTRFFHDSTNFNVEDETKHDRTVKPVVCRNANHERSMFKRS